MRPQQDTAEKKIHPALLANEIVGWTGGIDLLRLYIGGIDAVHPTREWNALLTTKSSAMRRAAGKLKRWILRQDSSNSPLTASVATVKDVVESMDSRVRISVCLDSHRYIARAMRRMGSDVLFPCMSSLGPSFPLGWAGYIPDLQHKHLPHFFSEEERARRDHIYGGLLSDARAVIVTSKSVMQDIEKFYVKRSGKLFALPFCPRLYVASPAEAGDSRLSRYDLPTKYFLISNQFWKHKSHETAFAALRIVREAGYDDVHILCTGGTSDHRWPGHFQNLVQGIERDRVVDRVRFLGLIPKLDQLAIMRHSLAVIQPTLFEGAPGGGSVSDAVATGTPAIISDIPVNREVDMGVIDFFSVGSAEDLAEKMIHNLQFSPARIGAEATLAMLHRRRHEMGKALLEALQFACTGSSLRRGGE